MSVEPGLPVQGKEIAEGYDKLYAGWLSDAKHYGALAQPQKHYGHRKHSQWLLDLLGVKADRSKKLLDVACGAGGFLYYADKRATCSGVDISPVAVKYASRLVPGANIAVGLGEAIPYHDAEFDYVTCVGSLEHFMDMDKGLGEMRRVLKEDGRLLVEVPNAFAISSIGLALLEADKGVRAEFQPIGRNGTLWGWRHLIEDNGFKVIKASPYNWRTHPLEFFRPEPNLRGLLRLGLRWTSFLIPKNLAEDFVYVAARA